MRPHSPARAHFEKTAAAQRTAEPAPTAGANQYELMLYKLAEDKRRLKGMQSFEQRAQVKRELLPEYEPWIEGVLTGDQGVQDDVLMTVMLWRIDAGNLPGALTIARYAIKHKLAMPDQYQRTVPCLLAEEFADISLKEKATLDADALLEVAELTAAEDMPDEVRAKLHKAVGYALRDKAGGDKTGIGLAYMEQALDHLRRALQLHDKCGVKKDIEKLERDIKNSATAAGNENPGSAG